MSAASNTIKSANDYAKTINAFTGIAGLRVDLVMRKLAFDALDGVFRRSPVDTGRFRGSWRVSLDEPDLSVEPAAAKGSKAAVSKGTPAQGTALAQLKAIRADVKRDRTIIISNNLPYARPLENGHSPQAPQGVVRPTFSELTAKLEAVIRQAKAEVPDA